jgi:hypothetical protein
VAIGSCAGQTGQGSQCVAVGFQAGQTGQRRYAVAIGAQAGQANLGTGSIAIGYLAGQTAQVASSICLNASAVAVNPATAGFFVNPVRGVATATPVVVYNTGTSELTYNTSSRRYKRDIIDMPYDTSAILKTRPVEYTSIYDDKRYVGFIAEEVNDCDTHFSWKNQESQPEGIEWFTMLTYLIAEVQKLRSEVDRLKQI